MSRMIEIKNCSRCPHRDHSGAYTQGGAWPVCHGPNVVDWASIDVDYNDPKANEKWSPPILPVENRFTRTPTDIIPTWCPLEIVLRTSK